MPEQSSPTGWTILKEYMRALPAGLPLTRVYQVPLPEDHPDLTNQRLRRQDAEVAEFTKGKAELVALEKQLWKDMRNGHRPEIPDLVDEVWEDMSGSDVLTHLAIDMATFELLADDIRAWVA